MYFHDDNQPEKVDLDTQYISKRHRRTGKQLTTAMTYKALV